MGLFENIRKKEKMESIVKQYFNLINGYTPCFTSFEGGIYEMELTRAAIHSFANHASKLKPEVMGSGNKQIERILQYRPNPLMDTKKYLYRIATVVSVDNTAFIAPLYDDNFNIVGFYPLVTSKCQQTKGQDGNTYIRYDFGSGQYGACELSNMGVLTQFQYKNELYGESNSCLRPTLEMIHTNNQGIIEGVKNGASIRFMAKLAQSLKSEDIAKERKRFVAENLGAENNAGVMLFDQKYEDVKKVDSTPFVVNAAQMKQIQENVFNYFGTNENILQNNFTSDQWSAYYEGKLEPFAIELGLVHTNMLFNNHMIAYGNEVMFSANRLQYMSTNEKLTFATQLFDRGIITTNDAREVFNMSKLEGGDTYYIRKEYAEVNKLGEDDVNATSHIEEKGEKNAKDEGQRVSVIDADGSEAGE